MDKLLLYPGRNEHGIFNFVIDAERNYLEKTAAEYHPEIARYINDAKPIKGKTQILLTALGAGEYWGNNSNGDWFPETALAHSGPDFGHKTFERHARVYRHHVNKPDSPSFGGVALSVYNPTYHRVELVLHLDNHTAGDIVQRIESGDNVSWSMGCKVPYDICNICGNKAPTRKQYCEHLRYYLGKVEPETGKVAYAINTMPKFFDISQVLIGADRTALTHMKVAYNMYSQPSYAGVSSALLAEKIAQRKRAAEDKQAEIEKEIPTNDPPYSLDTALRTVDNISEAVSSEPVLPRRVLDTLGSFPLAKALSTMLYMGIMPKPQEFQRIYLVGSGNRGLADEMDRRCECFDPLSGDPKEFRGDLGVGPENFDPYLMNVLSPHVSDRSFYAPHLTKRITIMIKSASYKDPSYHREESTRPTFIDPKADRRKPLNIVALLTAASAAFALLNKVAPSKSVAGIDKVIAAHPGLAAAGALGLFTVFNALAKPSIRGNIDPNSARYMNPDINDVHGRVRTQSEKPYVKYAYAAPKAGASVFAKQLIVGVPLAYVVSGVLQKQKEQNPHKQEGRMMSILRKYPDIVSGALAANAIASARGGGSAALLRSAKSVGEFPRVAKGIAGAKSLFKMGAADEEGLVDVSCFLPLLKLAEQEGPSKIGDILANSAIGALALRGANLPYRLASNLGEQLIFKGVETYNEKRKKPVSY